MTASSLAGVVAAALGALAARADASPLSEALARHSASDVTALRAQRTDVAARCTLGAIYARRNDLPRAALCLTGCDDAALPDDIAAPIRAALRDTKRRLDASRYSALAVLSRPDGLTVAIDALPGESFTTPATIWIPPGDHQLRATVGDRAFTQRVATEPHKNASVMLDTAPAAKPSAPRQASVDFAVDEPGGSLGENLSAPPPDIKHPSLLSDKYRGIASPSVDASLDDPLAAQPSTIAADRPLWLGARLGLGMFDDTQASARAGFALAAAARVPMTSIAFLAARADWTRRGGDATTAPVDTLGASAGLGITVLGRPPRSDGPPLAPSHLPTPNSRAQTSTPSDSPASDSPASNSPASNSPASNSPASNSPASNSPASGSPAADSPASNSPASNSPASDAPASGSPAADSPASGSTAASPGVASHGSMPPTTSHRPLAIALLAQLRGDVRLADRRADMPVRRTGLGLVAGVELTLPSTPFTVGLRFEQGLTDLVPGSRDRAFLAEIGIDLR